MHSQGHWSRTRLRPYSDWMFEPSKLIVTFNRIGSILSKSQMTSVGSCNCSYSSQPSKGLDGTPDDTSLHPSACVTSHPRFVSRCLDGTSNSWSPKMGWFKFRWPVWPLFIKLHDPIWLTRPFRWHPGHAPNGLMLDCILTLNNLVATFACTIICSTRHCLWRPCPPAGPEHTWHLGKRAAATVVAGPVDWVQRQSRTPL